MLEIEQKFRLTGNEPIEAGIAEMGAITLGEIMEEDHYFNAPDRDFAKTGEAFRIRRIGEKNFLTYKGPKTTTGSQSAKGIGNRHSSRSARF